MRSPNKDPRVDVALTSAIARLLGPLARLAVARGLTFPVFKELLKQEFVRAAREAQPGSGARDVSRVATATGLTRREVTRLSLEQPPALADRPSPATQLFTRWQADRKLRDRRGKPKVLPRQGPAPSFEALAQAKVNIELISTSSITITCMVRQQDVERAVRSLHEALHLEQGP